MKGIQRVLPSLFCMGVAHGRPAPGVVPNAGLAGGAGIHLDMMLTMGVEGMEAQPCGNAALAWARCWNLCQNLTAQKRLLLQPQLELLQLSWSLLPLLSTEPHQLLHRQNSRNLGRAGVWVLLCCLPGLSFSSSSRELQMGQSWEGSAAPEFPLGTVTLGVCSVLSSLVLWSLFEICLKPWHTRSWKLPD